MKHPTFTPSFTTRIQDIKRLCDLTRMITQADSMALVLFPGAWAGLAEPLIQAGVLARVEPADPASRADANAPYRIDGLNRHNSDTLSAAVPVRGADGTNLGRILLHQARPDALSTALSAQIMQIAQLVAARLVAEADQTEDLPLRMLSLIEALAERDTEAGSRVVTGFLRLVAGRTPTSVEATRLCIAGLAEPVGAGSTMPHPSGLRLTAEAGRILTGIGLLAALPLSHDLLPVAPAPLAVPAPVLAKPADFRAIANLSLGKSTHDIGESEDETRLAYRPAGSSADWAELRGSLADGWPEIATEIMLATQNALKDYVFTHMIHERQKDSAQDRTYSLYDLHWTVRDSATGLQGRLDDQPDWQDLHPLDVSFADDPREAAFAALLRLMPNLDQHIHDDVRAWLRRLASGATVVPIFMAQSA